MIVFWVGLFVVAILGVQALIWSVILVVGRGRQGKYEASLRDEVAAAGETITRGPESATYRGATAGYSQISGTGVILLTDQRLLFRKLTGGRIEVPLAEIAGVREAKVFLSSRRGGHPHLILQLHNGREVGFIVTDQAGWMAALRGAAGV